MNKPIAVSIITILFAIFLPTSCADAPRFITLKAYPKTVVATTSRAYAALSIVVRMEDGGSDVYCRSLNVTSHLGHSWWLHDDVHDANTLIQSVIDSSDGDCILITGRYENSVFLFVSVEVLGQRIDSRDCGRSGDRKWK